MITKPKRGMCVEIKGRHGTWYVRSRYRNMVNCEQYSGARTSYERTDVKNIVIAQTIPP